MNKGLCNKSFHGLFGNLYNSARFHSLVIGVPDQELWNLLFEHLNKLHHVRSLQLLPEISGKSNQRKYTNCADWYEKLTAQKKQKLTFDVAAEVLRNCTQLKKITIDPMYHC